MAGQNCSVFRFSDVEVHERELQLKRAGKALPVEPKAFRVLVYLLRNPGRLIPKNELLNAGWGDTAVTDNSLTRNIALLRRLLDDDIHAPRYIETVSTVGYRFICPVESVEDSSPTLNSENSTSQRTRWIFAFAMVLAGIVISLLALSSGGIFSHLLRQAGPQIRSIAVLPLQNLSGDPAQDYFSDGLTDELITEVAKIGALRVISRTSSMQYKGTHKSLSAIAKELGVDALVEGAVVRSGDRVRVTAQLIDARDDRHIWSESYDRNLVDVLPLQSEVAQTIADQVRVKLTSEQRASLASGNRVNSQSLEAYLKGSFFLNQGMESLDKSIESFSEAIQADPSNAQAYSGLSQSYLFLGIFGLRPSKEVYPKARAAAMKAIEIDATSAEAHAVLAEIAKGFDWDWAAAESEYKRALELNPSSSNTHALYADYLSMMERHDEAIAELRLSHALDPVSIVNEALFGFLYYRHAGMTRRSLRVGKHLNWPRTILTPTGSWHSRSRRRGEFRRRSQVFRVR